MRNITLFIVFILATFSVSAQVFDTSGISTWKRLVNSYDTWEKGAFDAYRDTSDPYDFGWGFYDITSHDIVGDSIYIIKTVKGNFKAISIDQLSSGFFSITYSNLDGSGKKSVIFDRSDFKGKNFFQYSLDEEKTKDLEPQTADWDIVFRKYIVKFGPGFYYPVTGVLLNRGVEVSQVEFQKGQSAQLSDTINFPFQRNISAIGYDWKKADQNGIEVYDTISYFVKDQNGNINELRFKAYGGITDGEIVFSINGKKDSISMKEDNVKEVYYSLENGQQIATNSDNDWDISFSALTSFSSIPVRVNDAWGTGLYVYPLVDIDFWGSIAGIENATGKLNFSVFPNPAVNSATIQFENDENIGEVAVSILDQTGKLVKSKQFNVTPGQSQYQLEINKLSKGVYIIRLENHKFSGDQLLIVN